MSPRKKVPKRTGGAGGDQGHPEEDNKASECEEQKKIPKNTHNINATASSFPSFLPLLPSAASGSWKLESGIRSTPPNQEMNYMGRVALLNPRPAQGASASSAEDSMSVNDMRNFLINMINDHTKDYSTSELLKFIQELSVFLYKFDEKNKESNK